MKTYDVVIIGAGFGGLALAALLAKSEKSVLLLEANNEVGGHAYTMQVGDYKFCHDVQYLMGCQEGGPMRRFLNEIGVDIEFTKMEEKSYDLISIQGRRIKVPLGMDNYCAYLGEMFPKYQRELQKFFTTEKKIFREAKGYERVLQKKDVLVAPWRFPTIIRNIRNSLQDVFDHYRFPPELQAILAGRMGNMSAMPKNVSFLMYAGMDVAYSESAFFPKKGMQYLVERIVSVIEENGGNVLKKSEVTKINKSGKRIISVQTGGKEFTANYFVSNIDPQATLQMTDTNIPKRFQYEYSDSIFCIYLGLRDFDLKKHGFNKHNIWHHSTKDLNAEYWVEIKQNDFSHPWLFISTPSLLTEEGVLCPKGSNTMEILTFVNYDYFKKLYSNKKEYEKRIQEIYEEIIEIVEKNYLPDLRKHIESTTIHTPVDMEKILRIPKGNVYGVRATPKNFSLNRVNYKSPYTNLYFVGAAASFPGIMGVTVGAMDLYGRIRW